MPETPFLVTIDTEGDDLWSRPRRITTRNAAWLPRFQALCERYGFKPVYLANFEMAMSVAFVEFARDVLARGAGEVGMHLHAWNSPPLEPLTRDDFYYQPYLVEYPERVMREKIRTLTGVLEDRFACKMASHRAGRWALDARYAALLVEAGYRIDCSVTPGIDWRGAPGDPAGAGGADYRGLPDRPYYFSDALLEVPVTVRAGRLYRHLPVLYRVPGLRRAAGMLSPAPRWLCPAESSLGQMLQVAREARAEGAEHLEFALHSSELMPGGSPAFRAAADIERLYDDLEALFAALAPWCRGMTLQEFEARR
jgi:hypothetical protein